jgi:hypothetical protein
MTTRVVGCALLLGNGSVLAALRLRVGTAAGCAETGATRLLGEYATRSALGKLLSATLGMLAELLAGFVRWRRNFRCS